MHCSPALFCPAEPGRLKAKHNHTEKKQRYTEFSHERVRSTCFPACSHTATKATQQITDTHMQEESNLIHNKNDEGGGVMENDRGMRRGERTSILSEKVIH